MPNALFGQCPVWPMPNAPCPMPHAPCPVCPMPHAPTWLVISL
ncbi:hypothetical protein QUA96_02705 [Microcoleus sp. F6_B3]